MNKPEQVGRVSRCIRVPLVGISLVAALVGCAARTAVRPSAEPALGADGSTVVASAQGAWTLSGRVLSYRLTDGSWRQSALPVGVPAGSVEDVRATAGGLLVAALGSRGAVTVSRLTGAAWTTTTLPLRWPDGLPIAAPPGVSFAVSSGAIVAVAATERFSNASGVANLFVSRDGGVSFGRVDLPRQTPLNTAWSSVSFDAKGDGTIVGGPASTLSFVSHDAGRTWSAAAVGGLPARHHEEFIAQPVLAGSRVLLPVYTDDAAGEQVLTLVENTAGRLSAAAPAPLVVAATFQAGSLPVASGPAGQIWVLSADARTLHVGSGTGWTKRSVTGLPSNVTGLTLTGGERADASVSQTVCRSGKTDCSTTGLSYSTADGGRTWHRR